MQRLTETATILFFPFSNDEVQMAQKGCTVNIGEFAEIQGLLF